jgi:hypothetical protein
VLYARATTFAINPLPDGTSAEDMADLVRRASSRVYPRSTFLNGFCFMIRRAVLNAVGYMDEIAFPRGYGEENDFCMRAQDAGFALAIADDAYVFHAKSKSFGTDQRLVLSQAGDTALKDKYGEDKVNALLDGVTQTEQMDRVRRQIRLTLADCATDPSQSARQLITTQRILFILPVRGGGGGAHSVVQEVAAMRALGVDAKVAVLDADFDDYLTLYGDIKDAPSMFTSFSIGACLGCCQRTTRRTMSRFSSTKTALNGRKPQTATPGSPVRSFLPRQTGYAAQSRSVMRSLSPR